MGSQQGPFQEYSQTILQLYRQLTIAGYPTEDISRVRAAYHVAMVAFAGWYRGSGKPFLDHLVGTAAILCAVRAPGTVIAGGLLHAIYSLGEYANREEALWKRNREKVKQAVGEQCEDYVFRYSLMEWSQQAVPALEKNLSTMPTEDQMVVLMRLANELEDHHDLGILYCANAAERRQNVQDWLDQCARLADSIQQPELAVSLRSVSNEVMAAEVPSYLRSASGVSFRLGTVDRESTETGFIRLLRARPSFAIKQFARKCLAVIGLV